MQIVFHLGAHATDEDRLIKCLLRNKGLLAQAGIAVPGPSRYRLMLRDLHVRLKGRRATPAMQEILLDAIMDEDSAGRLVLSHEYFLCVPHRVIAEGGFYPMAGRKVRALANVFPDHAVEFHMALRNPATLLPALLARIDGVPYGKFMDGVGPGALGWAEVVAEMVAAVPEARFVIWCNEDTPLLWPEILARVAGLPEAAPGLSPEIEGGYDLAASLLAPDGAKRLKVFLSRRRIASDRQRRRMLAAFLDRFGRAEAMEVEVALPGWTEAVVAEVSARYDADLARIAALPGVDLMLP